jgi:hypothetical protein
MRFGALRHGQLLGRCYLTGRFSKEIIGDESLRDANHPLSKKQGLTTLRFMVDETRRGGPSTPRATCWACRVAAGFYRSRLLIS